MHGLQRHNAGTNCFVVICRGAWTPGPRIIHGAKAASAVAPVVDDISTSLCLYVEAEWSPRRRDRKAAGGLSLREKDVVDRPLTGLPRGVLKLVHFDLNSER